MKDTSLRGIVKDAGFTQETFYGCCSDKTAQCRGLSTGYLNYFINYIYDNFDAFKLVICCSEGTKYADYIHDLVEIEVFQTEDYYDQLQKLGKADGTVSHIITSAYFTAVFETVAHDMTREHAVAYVNELAAFFNFGWDGFIPNTPSEKFETLMMDIMEKSELPLAHMIPELTANIPMPVLMLFYLFFSDWHIALISLVTIPIGLICCMGIMKNNEKRYSRVLTAGKNIDAAVAECLSGI